MRPRAIIGLVLLVGFTAVLLSTFARQVSEYQGFDQAEASGKKVHVVGTWKRDSATRYDPQKNTFSFRMLDEHGTERIVEYGNPKPPNFEEAERLVIQGRAHGEIFVADHILVKCPSKYNETSAPPVGL